MSLVFFIENEKASIIKPSGLTESRVEELEYFKAFVDANHKQFISLNIAQ